jgi:hypothetical protein|tara:strand:- start:251 stop:523 length:273 start_codon:yes stop_codon:yes gene_type:complete
MDIRAFGSTYGQQGVLPYASGFAWAPGDGEKTFTTCRALYLEGSAANTVYIELNDAPGQYLLTTLGDNKVLPYSATALSGGDMSKVTVLY